MLNKPQYELGVICLKKPILRYYSNISGLLHPRASSSAVPVAAIQPTLRHNTANIASNTQRRETRSRRSESTGRMESDRQTIQRTIRRNQPLTVQSQEFHNYKSQSIYHQQQLMRQQQQEKQQQQHTATTANVLSNSSHYQTVKPERSFPTHTLQSQKQQHIMSNGLEMGNLTITHNNNKLPSTKTGSHLVNGKLYAARSGHIINSHGQVVNLTDGEVMSLDQAERLGIVQRMTDKDHHSGQSYVPASNMMFNRVGIAFVWSMHVNAILWDSWSCLKITIRRKVQKEKISL